MSRREMTAADVEMLRERLSYDKDTGALTWLAGQDAGKPAGTTSNTGYVHLNIGHKWYPQAHRVAWALHYGTPPPAVIDHINCNRSDNRIANLRAADKSTNAVNSRRRLRAGSGALGVRKQVRSWIARIKKGYRDRSLGNFGTLDEAAHAYNKAAVALFGDFATLNPVGTDPRDLAAALSAPARGEEER